jgi:hypothetical protein
MSSPISSSAIVIPNTKQPVPPPYRGLPDSATFARLASRPDRIEPEAVAFFNSWLFDTGLAIRGKDGRLVLRREFVPIGAAARLARVADAFADVSAASSSATVPAAKK